ncbi:uncharacterized protein METZ01_LOCUS402386 [marine metagenome]|uniref:Uncharacterized protein n=1 Tax=marine metagenome TaxID=408172 RepID=A0A382VSQ2_9ZZZZ
MKRKKQLHPKLIRNCGVEGNSDLKGKK